MTTFAAYASCRAASSAVTDRTVPVAATSGRGLLVTGAESAGDDAQQRPVHRDGHQLGEDATGRADQCAGDDQRSAADHESGHRDRRTGARVQQRDDHRHVGSADRQSHQYAERQRGDRQHGERRARTEMRGVQVAGR